MGSGVRPVFLTFGLLLPVGLYLLVEILLFQSPERAALVFGNAKPCVHPHLLTSAALGAVAYGSINLYLHQMDVVPPSLGMLVLFLDLLGLIHYGRALAAGHMTVFDGQSVGAGLFSLFFVALFWFVTRAIRVARSKKA